MKYLTLKAGWTGVVLALGTLSAHAGCRLEQTAANEIVIKSSVGGCNGAALRESLSGAITAGDAAIAAEAAARDTALAGVKRNSSQNALWRLANTHNQSTTLTMPGMK